MQPRTGTRSSMAPGPTTARTGGRIDAATQSRTESHSSMPASSEPYDGGAGDLDLLQGILTEAERIAEAARVFVVQHGRLVSEVASKTDRLPGEVFDAPAEAERELGLGLAIVRAEKRGAEACERKEAQPRVSRAEMAHNVAVHLAN